MEVKLLTCRNCGEPLNLSNAKNYIIKCKHCNAEHVLPKDETPEEVKRYLGYGQKELDVGNFDEALTCFDKALEIEEKEPEAYFGKFLAKHKVQYLKDIVNNRLQPIVHELIEGNLLEDSDYKKALKFANDEQKEIYQRRVEEIDQIKKSFMELDKSKLDYDCFICVKVTDNETKGRTKDYKAAEDIYFALRRKGYKPFLSEMEIKGRTGSDYEAMILYALMMSECMLVVCSNEEYLNTKWVKNEYTRFLKLVNDEVKESDAITIIFDGKPIEKLPGKKGKIQGINLEDLDAMEIIEKYVYNHTPKAKKEREEKQKAKLEEENELKKQLAEQAKLIKEIREMQNGSNQSSSSSSSTSSNLEHVEEIQNDNEEYKDSNPNQSSLINESDDKILDQSIQNQKEKEIKKSHAKKQQAQDLQEKRNNAVSNGFIFATDDNNKIVKYVGESNEIEIPDFVTSIGDSAFEDCKSITSITIPNSVKSIGEKAFSGCWKLTSITIPNSVTGIGKEAFKNCFHLKSIKIPSSVKSIGDSAFSYCSSLTIYCEASSKPSEWNTDCTSDSPVYWGINESNYLEQDGLIYVLVDNTIVVTGHTNEIASEVAIPKTIKIKEVVYIVTSIGENAFSECSKLTSITIPNSVTSIGDSAFSYCSSLTSIEIPNSVTSIGKKAFSGCRKLTSIVIPNSVTSISKSTFSSCSSLTSIIIPSSVTSIGDFAFEFCNSLTTIVIPSTVTNMENCVFQFCDKLINIKCEAKKKPDNWSEFWNYKSVFKRKKRFFDSQYYKVKWGYKR